YKLIVRALRKTFPTYTMIAVASCYKITFQHALFAIELIMNFRSFCFYPFNAGGRSFKFNTDTSFKVCLYQVFYYFLLSINSNSSSPCELVKWNALFYSIEAKVYTVVL